MIKCKELNTEFKTKGELFKALRDNKDDIIAMKRAQILKSHEKNQGLKVNFLDTNKLNTAVKGIDFDDNYYYLAVNSTRVLDSHKDVHLDGIWNKSVKEQQGRNYLVLDHELKVSQTVVKKEHIEMIIADIPFAMIGKSYDGNTQALIYKFPKDKIINKDAKAWLESGDDIEASVRMQYVKISLAMDSTLKEDVDEKKEYDSQLEKIANRDEFDEIDYFFTVYEAKNVSESSLVPFGSNGATGIINDVKDIQADKSLENKEVEPTKDTQSFANII